MASVKQCTQSSQRHTNAHQFNKDVQHLVGSNVAGLFINELPSSSQSVRASVIHDSIKTAKTCMRTARQHSSVENLARDATMSNLQDHSRSFSKPISLSPVIYESSTSAQVILSATLVCLQQTLHCDKGHCTAHDSYARHYSFPWHVRWQLAQTVKASQNASHPRIRRQRFFSLISASRSTTAKDATHQ